MHRLPPSTTHTHTLFPCTTLFRSRAAVAVPAIASAQSGDHVTLGAGAGVVPDNQGSDDYRFLPIPVIDAQYGQFFVSLRNGIGVNVIEIGQLTAGASVALVGGYRRRDVPDGVRRVAPTAGGRLFANLKLDKLSFTVGDRKRHRLNSSHY